MIKKGKAVPHKRASSWLGQSAPKKRISPTCVKIGVTDRTTINVSTYMPTQIDELNALHAPSISTKGAYLPQWQHRT